MSAVELEKQALESGRNWNRDSVILSRFLYKLASEKYKKSGELSAAAENLRKSARKDILLAEYLNALSKLKKVLKIESVNTVSGNKAITYSLISLTYLKLAKLTESKTALDKALVLSRRSQLLTPKAETFHAAAEFYYSKFDLKTAKTFYKKSLELWQEIGNVPKEANVLIDYGYVFMSTGNPFLGLEYIRTAESKFKSLNNIKGITMSKIALGHLYSTLGDKQTALDLYKQAEQTFPENIDLLLKTYLLNGMSFIYEGYGESKISLDYARKSFKIVKSMGHIEGHITMLSKLVNLYYLTNDKTSARKHFSELTTLVATNQNSVHFNLALRFTGDQHFRHNLNKQALYYYLESLKRMGNLDLMYEIALLNTRIGTIHFRQKNLPKARRHYKQALKITRESSNKLVEAQVSYRLAELDFAEGKTEDALENVKNSIELTEHFTTSFLNSKNTSTYFSKVYERYELYIEILMKMHERFPSKGFDMQAFQASEKSRSRSLLENLRLSEANFTADADPKTVKREKETKQLLNIKSERLTNLLNQNSKDEEIKKLDGEINQLHNTLADIQAELKQKSPIYTAIKNPTTFDKDDFQDKILDKNTVLVEFALGKKNSYLWLLGKDTFDVFTLPNKEIIEKKIDRLRKLMVDRKKLPREDVAEYQNRISANEREYWKLAQTLSDQLFGQTSGKLTGKRIIVVPDGKLRYFPISALPVPDTDNNAAQNEPFILHNEIVYEPSASTLQLLRLPRQGSNMATKDFVVFADPVFSKKDKRLISQERSVKSMQNLQRLPASMEEADAILKRFGVDNTTLVSGFSATRKSLLNTKLQDYRVLHFATHGLLNEERPELSGIALSQFDAEGNDLNGFVRLQDIYGMNLSADLVVLSACDTGIGKELKGEGLISLTNGFLQAGAKSVISSRWKVDDYATLELMNDFYRVLKTENVTPSEALRKAQINMYKNSAYKSPFYWAAFSVQGEFRNRTSLSSKFNYRNYFYLLMFVIGLFTVVKIYRSSKNRSI